MTWSVYILHCANGSYYVGHAVDVEARLATHSAGFGARHTAVYPPDAVVYRELFDTETDAVRRERQIKKWSHAKKVALIDGDLSRLRELAKSRD